jgi:Helix-turn-helix domain of resolvase
MHAAGEKPAHIARRLGVARSSVYRMLEDTSGPGGSLAAVGDRGIILRSGRKNGFAEVEHKNA